MKKKHSKTKYIVVAIVAVAFVVIFAGLLGKVAEEKNLTYYKQTLVYNSDFHTLDGKEVVGFYNQTGQVLEELCLHLYANAFKKDSKASVVSLANYDKAYPNGKSYGNIQIESVEAGDKYLEYEVCGQDENILKISLPKELYPDELFEFEIGFCVNLANINHRLGYGKNTVNLCNYFPIVCAYENGEFLTDLYNSNGDPFYSKMANFEVEITYPKSFVLASTGKQKNVLDGENKITTIKAQNVRDFAMVLSEKFETVIENYGGVEINYYYYGDSTPKNTIKTIKEVLDFNKKYGEYPYNTLSVVEANFVHGGMEYPNIVLISDDLADYETYTNVVIHELCHQWWYGVVGNNQYLYGFLDEGLTDYTTARFYDANPKYGISADKIFKNASASYANFLKVYTDVNPNFSSKMIKPLNQFSNETEYVQLSYVKGMLMFASLEDLLGTKKMDKCIEYYYKTYKFSEANPADLANAFSKASHHNLNSFFNSWFEGNEVVGQF